MRLLAAGVDTTVIALWLGHENVATTQIYIHADLALKEKGLGPDHTPARHTGPLPAHRQHPGLPRQLVDYADQHQPRPVTANASPTRVGITSGSG
jgi:hypothetical protein